MASPSMTGLERIARVLEKRGFTRNRGRWVLAPWKVTARIHGSGWISLNLYASILGTGNAWVNSAHVDPATRNMEARLRNFLKNCA